MPEPQRLWSLRQATEALPQIEELLQSVADIVRERQESMEQVEDLRIVYGEAAEVPGTPENGELKHHLHRVQDAQARLQQILEAFFVQGVEIVDPELGRVQFLSHMGATLVNLCYERGAGTITTWHDLLEEWEDRKPIPSADFD